jgi:tetratricopeptide (TPR) repeat protein
MRFLVETTLSISLIVVGIGQGHAAQPKAGGSLEPVLTLLKQGKIEEGERMLRQRIKENPDDSAARRLLGRVADFDGRPDEAVKTWEEGLKQTAEDFPLLMEIGQIRARQGRDGPTISYRRGMVAAQPSSDEKAEEKFKKEHLALAAKAFERALALAPHESEAALKLARVYSDAKNHEAAVKVWRRLHELNGDDTDVALGLARSLTAAGRTDEGAKVYQKAIELNPRLASAHMALADYYKAKGDAAAADKARRQADFYEALPPFTRLTYSAENVAMLARLFEAATVKKLIDDSSDRAADFLVVLCWSHPHNELEDRAFESLEKRGPSTVPLLRQLLRQARSTCTIRSSARILARQKDPGLLEQLLPLLPGDTRTFGFHMDIAGALAELGDLRAVGPLVEVLNVSDRTPVDRAEVILCDRTGARARAAMALGKLDASAGRKALKAGLDHPELGPFCAAALYRLTREAEYLSTLRKAMTGDNRYAAFLLVGYLRQMETPEARQMVKEWDQRAKEEEEKAKATKKGPSGK